MVPFLIGVFLARMTHVLLLVPLGRCMVNEGLTPVPFTERAQRHAHGCECFAQATEGTLFEINWLTMAGLLVPQR